MIDCVVDTTLEGTDKPVVERKEDNGVLGLTEDNKARIASGEVCEWCKSLDNDDCPYRICRDEEKSAVPANLAEDYCGLFEARI